MTNRFTISRFSFQRVEASEGHVEAIVEEKEGWSKEQVALGELEIHSYLRIIQGMSKPELDEQRRPSEQRRLRSNAAALGRAFEAVRERKLELWAPLDVKEAVEW